MKEKITSAKSLGLGLLELVVTLTISAFMAVMYIRMQSDAQSQIRTGIASGKLQEITSAGQAYMSANANALLTATTGGVLVQIPVARTNSSDASPPGFNASLPSLQGGGYLNEAFIDQNSYGQNHIMLVTLDGVGNLVGLIAEIGGKPILDQNLGQIINKMGASGGAVFGNNPTLIQGAGGGYQYNISAWGGIPKPGHAVSEINLSIPAMTQYLYRNNIGVPTANQMDTAIDMGGNGIHNNITNAGTVTMDTINGQNGGFACAGQIAGCSFWLGQDGYFQDNNDGWTRFIGTSATGGLVVSGPAGGGNLQVGGGQTVAGTFQAYTNAIIGGNLTVTGNVGIGTTTPQSVLDINGEARIGNSGAICQASNNGAIRYDGPTSVLRYCNGVKWVLVASGPYSTGGVDMVYTEGTSTFAYCRFSWGAASCDTIGNAYCSTGVTTGTAAGHDDIGWGEVPANSNVDPGTLGALGANIEHVDCINQ